MRAAASFALGLAALSAAASAKPRVAVMSAFAPEWGVLRDAVEGAETDVMNGVTFVTGSPAGREVVLFLSGISMVNAAMTTRFALDHFEIATIVFSGIAGGVDPELLALAETVAGAIEQSDGNGEGICLSQVAGGVGGHGVSGQAFVDNADFRSDVLETFEARGLDMESAAVAHVAWADEVPFIAFRSLSDLAGGCEGENEMETFFRSPPRIRRRW